MHITDESNGKVAKNNSEINKLLRKATLSEIDT